MAHRLILSAPVSGLPFIWNINSTVGARKACINAPSDVRLAKLLLKINLDGGNGAYDTTPSVVFPPVVNESFDHGLAFWIYHNQDIVNNNPDGIISPSPKFASVQYMIVRLNAGAKQVNSSAWENLPGHPLCGPVLAAELLAPPR